MTDVEVSDLFIQAEFELDSHNFTAARDMILPNIDRFPQPSDRAHAFRLLGATEAAQGKHEIAAGYYRQLCELEPTGNNYFLLAQAYDLSGDLCKAQEAYHATLDNPQPATVLYYDFSITRAADLEKNLADCSCGCTPAP
jgi:tetratricopeptide (TPR) repeat protein